MLDEQKITQLQQSLKRIFALPITRLTFREIQNNVSMIFDGHAADINAILECLVRGEISGDRSKKESAAIKELIDEFSTLIKVAKDVLERGEFLSLITSDTMTQYNKAMFVNRIRRIDGEEFQFVTDPETSLQLLQHFLTRVEDLEKNDTSKKIVTGCQKELSALKSKLEQLISP